MIHKKTRTYIPAGFEIKWESLEPLYTELRSRQINSVAALEKWLHDRSEVEAALEEDFAIQPTKSCYKTFNILLQKLNLK
jgi:oligoendopeptidase F